MSKLLNAVVQGMKAMTEAPAGERYIMAGKVVSCGHCSHDRFVKGEAQLSTAGMTFLHLDWANRSATVLICSACGHIEWFLATPEVAG